MYTGRGGSPKSFLRSVVALSGVVMGVALACSSSTHDFTPNGAGSGGDNIAGTEGNPPPGGSGGSGNSTAGTGGTGATDGGSTAAAGGLGEAGSTQTGEAGGPPGGDCAPGDTEPCYETEGGTSLGPIPVKSVGSCKVGVRTCSSLLVWGSCVGAVAPLPSDSCEPGNDANCNDMPNEGCSCTNNQTRPCGSDVGECAKGTQTCTNASWGPCVGEVTAATTDTCEAGNDANCNGSPNNGCECINGAKQECGNGTGNCRKGEKTCTNGIWGSCVGGVTPQTSDKCSPVGDDANCNGVPNEGCDCTPGATRACAKCGTQTCDNAGKWSLTCAGQKTCEPGEIKSESESCGNCGTQDVKYTCSNACAWGPKVNVGSCLGSGPCKAGVTADQSQTVACGNCGTQTQTRSCNAACDWGSWTNSGTCMNSGCTPGTSIPDVSVSCEFCGEQKKKRTCNAQCTYGGVVNDGACIQNECSTMPGDERTNYVTCLHPDTTNVTCLPSQQCCVSSQGGYSCKTSCATNGTEMRAACDGPEDCPGARCCMQFVDVGTHPNFNYEISYTMCAATCPSLTRCHSDAECAAYYPGTDRPHCSKFASASYHNGICYFGDSNP